MLACMNKKRKVPRSSPRSATKPARLELRPDRAFVLHLDVHAKLPHHVVGRVEHVTSGEVSHVTCVGELVAFMAKVLRHRARGKRRENQLLTPL